MFKLDQQLRLTGFGYNGGRRIRIEIGIRVGIAHDDESDRGSESTYYSEVDRNMLSTMMPKKFVLLSESTVAR